MTRHDLDVFSLLSGLVLTGIALVALFGVVTGIASWVWPTVLIGIGVVVIALSLARSTDDGDRDDPTTPSPDRAAAMAAARDEVEQADRGAPTGEPTSGDPGPTDH